MVLALLAGRKTQTRRLATSPLHRTEVGDRLWVRETFQHWRGSASHKTAVYAADDTWLDHGSGETFVDKVTWLTPATPPIHMPRWASRLTLEVTDVRVEHLQAISRADAIAEGLCLASDHIEEVWRWPEPDHEGLWLSPRAAYRWLWGQLHGRESWDANPEVVALTFEVKRGNIDA